MSIDKEKNQQTKHLDSSIDSDLFRKNLDLNFYRYQIQLFIEAKRITTFAEIEIRFSILTDQEILDCLSELIGFKDIIKTENGYSIPFVRGSGLQNV